jgi:hypothetical protein
MHNDEERMFEKIATKTNVPEKILKLSYRILTSIIGV